MSWHPAPLPEHHPETRVREAVTLLQTLWGDELPPADEPWRTALLDAVTADDAAGLRRGVVVQADGLTHVALAALVRAAGPHVPAMPPALLRLLQDVPTVHQTTDVPAPETGPDDVVGLWEYDFATRTVMFDETCGDLLGEGAVAVGDRPLGEAVSTTIHPDDRQRVRDAMDAAGVSGPAFELVFRSRQPDGSYVTLLSRGRIIAPGSRPARLLGTISRARSFSTV